MEVMPSTNIEENFNQIIRLLRDSKIDNDHKEFLNNQIERNRAFLDKIDFCRTFLTCILALFRRNKDNANLNKILMLTNFSLRLLSNFYENKKPDYFRYSLPKM